MKVASLVVGNMVRDAIKLDRYESKTRFLKEFSAKLDISYVEFETSYPRHILTKSQIGK